MNAAELRAFVAIARSGSFSRAAEQLFLTQPAVSKRIAGLEGELGVRLFDRAGREVALTEAGRTLLPRARRILDEIEDSRRALHNLSGRVEGSLAVGTSHHIGLHRLPPVLRAFTARYPAVQLDLQFMASESVTRAVQEGRLEFGIITLPGTCPEGLVTEPVWDDPMVMVTHADHPLRQRHAVVPRDFAPFPAILPDPATYTRVLIDNALRSAGLEPRTAFTTNYLETIKMMVTVGLGWSMLPRTMLGEGLISYALAGIDVRRQLGVVRHRGRTLSNAARALAAILEEH